MFRNFREYMAQFLHGKTVLCFVYSKNLEHYEKRLMQKIVLFVDTRSQLFIKKVYLRIS